MQLKLLALGALLFSGNARAAALECTFPNDATSRYIARATVLGTAVSGEVNFEFNDDNGFVISKSILPASSNIVANQSIRIHFASSEDSGAADLNATYAAEIGNYSAALTSEDETGESINLSGTCTLN